MDIWDLLLPLIIQAIKLRFYMGNRILFYGYFIKEC